MSQTMRAAVYYGAEDIRVEERPVPQREPGEALVRVIRAGICGTDASEWISGPKVFPIQRAHPNSGHLGPLIPGHEFVGEVVDVDSTAGISVGNRVVSGAGIWCGECARCREGRTNLCDDYTTIGLNVHGALAEYVSVPSKTLRTIPSGLSVDHAALAQPLAVGIHAARRSGAKNGDNVVIIGAGAIGSFVLVGLKHLSDVNVIVVDFPGHKLERALRLGADGTLSPSENLMEQVIDAFAGLPDVVIEASGAPGQLNEALRMARDGGRVLAVGIPKGSPALDIHSMVFREVTLDSTLAHVCGDDLPAALEILEQGILGAELAEEPVGLSMLGASLDALAAGNVDGKVLIDPSKRS